MRLDRLDMDKVRANVAKADTEDLLDRATVYRAGMEPEALDLIDAELHARGVGETEIAAHRERRGKMVADADGIPLKCCRCARPATVRRWSWHRLWGVLPVFPRPIAYCEVHLPKGGR